MAASHAWAFRASFRRNAFGWSDTRKAIERLNEAVGEIERVARADPALAGEGAVLLLEKLSPAVNRIDSSSGALGNATARVVETMVPFDRCSTRAPAGAREVARCFPRFPLPPRGRPRRSPAGQALPALSLRESPSQRV